MKVGIIALFSLLLILVSGCASAPQAETPTIYLCPDQSVVEDPADCSKPESKSLGTTVIGPVQVVGGDNEETETEEEADEPLPKVEIINFCNISSANCIIYYNNIGKKIISTYGETVELNYKYYSVLSDIDSQFAYMAALCAKNQDKFDEYFRTTIDNRSQVSEGSLKRYAKDLGLNTTLFNSCYNSKETMPKVESNIAEGRKNDITILPTTFIGGTLVHGHSDFTPYQEAIDTEIARLRALES